MIKRVFGAGLLAIVLCFGTVWYAITHVPSVERGLYRALAAHGLAQAAPDFGDARSLSVLLCGTGSPLPDPRRAGPCTLISAGGHLYLVDAGFDSTRNLMLWHVPLEKIDAILITHFHSDHIGELGEIRLQTWVAGRRTPLPVYGPPGVEQVVDGFNEAYALDAGYRTKHHGAAFLPPAAVPLVAKPVAISSDTTAPVLALHGLKITAIRVHHDPATPAYGYRFDFAGRSVTVSGDTAADEDLAQAASGSDVLVHEALNPAMVAITRDALLAAGRLRQAKIMHDIPSYHTSPIDAARIANEAHARLLVYTHLLPLLPNASAEHLFLEGVSDVRPEGVVLGHDGLLIRLPGGTSEIDQTTLN